MSDSLIETDTGVPTRGKLLFEGRDILARGYFPDDARTLIVSFTSRTENPEQGHRKEGFGERFLDASGVAYLCFISRANHWWQTAEVEDCFRAIDAKYGLERYQRVITYGSSMGAYGALIFSRLLRASLVLAFSPQASIAGTELPIMPQWRIDMEGVPIILEPISRGLSETAQIVIPFDSINVLDLAHVRALEAIRPCERLVVPMSGHKTSLFLNDGGLLKSIVLAGVEQPVSVARLRQMIRDGRQSSWRYWSVLAARFKNRKWLDVAAAAEKQSLDLMAASGVPEEDQHASARRYVSRLISARQGRLAIEFARGWVETHPSAWQAHDLYSQALIARAKVKPAISAARAAVELKPRNAQLQLRLVTLLADNGKRDIANRHLQEAVKGTGAGGTDWLNAALALQRGGDEIGSRLAAEQGLAAAGADQKIVRQLQELASGKESQAV
ncbi:MAG TPA: hypothetical protein VGM17_12690 [Rhizomicrobium sp.]|jgi:hypothetical protein